MPFGVGPMEIVIVLVIVLLVFGPKRLPDLGRSLGRGMREFKDSVTAKDSEELPPPEPEAEPGPEPVPTSGAAREQKP